VAPDVSIELLILLLIGVAVLAGLLGSLAGLGGGVVLVPTLVVLFGVPFPFAVGASAVSVLATSTATASSYVSDRLVNLRAANFLQLATVSGAILGATFTVYATQWNLVPALLVILGLILLATLPATLRRRHEDQATPAVADPWSARLGLSGSYRDERLGREVEYTSTGTAPAFGIMLGAGVVSGLFGIGSGILKVLALEGQMHLPIKVATATSNLMIGVTVTAGVGILLAAGYIDPVLAAPVALGTAIGSLAGSRVLPRLSNITVRWIFIPTLVALSLELILRGVGWI
jgi:uncharacterized membrane protein YfcA